MLGGPFAAEPGADGAAAPRLSKEEEQKLEDESFKVNFFNDYRSSRLPLNRSIPDTRVPECKQMRYDLASLPTMSVVICFVDETWSALLRTVWSVVNRTPRELLAEIVLIDDGSSRPWLVVGGCPRDGVLAPLTMVGRPGLGSRCLIMWTKIGPGLCASCAVKSG